MKATEFCQFFDFTLEREGGVDEWDGEYNYVASDNQGCWDDRHAENIEDITDWFDACLHDYLRDDLEEDGFKPNANGNYWEQALEWCKTNDMYKDSQHMQVIACLLDPELIEDDTEGGD